MLKVDTVCMETQAQRMRQIAEQLNDISSRVAAIDQRLRWDTSVTAAVRSSLRGSRNAIGGLEDPAAQLARVLQDAADRYQRAEKDASSCVGSGAKEDRAPALQSVVGTLDLDPVMLRNETGAKSMAASIAGTKWRDYTKDFLDVLPILYNGLGSIMKYKQIGNAVGTAKSVGWWFNNAIGFRPGRAAAKQGFFKTFKRNLTNTTSPYNAMLRETVKDFSGKNGVGKAALSWGTVLVSGVLNCMDNLDEQKASGGKMSTGRVVAETVVETAIDTAVGIGGTIVVGAAITAITGTVAAPALVFVATGAAVAGINALVQNATGKSATEFVSDAILDTAEEVGKKAKKIGKAVGKAAKNVGKSVGKWFKKLSFA